jgi:hypothetical protein
MKHDDEYLRAAIDEVCGACLSSETCPMYARHRQGNYVPVMDCPEKCQGTMARTFEHIWVPPHNRPL